MTCCADDTTFIGFICKSSYAPKLAQGEWVEVTAKVAVENQAAYRGYGPVLYAEHVEVCDPLPEEMVYLIDRIPRNPAVPAGKQVMDWESAKY